MKFLYSLNLIFYVFVISKAAEVRLIDLDPSDAQQIIDKQDTSLKYAPKIDSNVPAVRFLGNEPHNVVEDIYLANQYHGQDGVGGYLYGYSVPDIAKTERKRPDGDLKGAYNYIAGNGQEIKVEYWDDGTGFHQIDNVPKILPKQIDDTPEVKAAKEEHARIWREQAERNSHPIANPYDDHATQGQQQFGQQQFAQQPQYHGQPQGQYQGQPQGQYVGQYQGQHQGQPQGQYQGQYSQPQAQFSQGPQSQYNQQKPQLAQTYDQNDIYSGQYSETRNTYAQNRPLQGQQGQHQQGNYQQGQQGLHQQGQQGQYQQGQQGQYQQGQQGQQHQGQQGQYQQGQQQGKYQEGEEEEVTGPPKGFFYSFDYPVGIIVSKDGGSIQKREGDLKGIYAENKAVFEAQLKGQASGQGASYLVQQ